MTIVVAYTRTEEGESALRAAAAEAARAPQEEVVLVPAERHEAGPDAEDVARRWPDLAGHLVVDHGDLHDPSDSVVQVAQRRDARLVVLGLAHRSAVGKMIFGSTAQRILLDATCPVLAVKP